MPILGMPKMGKRLGPTLCVQLKARAHEQDARHGPIRAIVAWPMFLSDIRRRVPCIWQSLLKMGTLAGCHSRLILYSLLLIDNCAYY